MYVPEMRKPRRAASAWVDGIYMPRYTAAGESGGGPVPIGTGQTNGLPADRHDPADRRPEHPGDREPAQGLRRPRAPAERVPLEGPRRAGGCSPRSMRAPSAGPPSPTGTTARRGSRSRSDRFDVRWAVVIEGVARRRTDEVAAVQLWIDWQTGQPLYFISKRDNGLLLTSASWCTATAATSRATRLAEQRACPRLRSGRCLVLFRAGRRQRLAARVLRRALAPARAERPAAAHVDGRRS